ncbi:MAG: PEP-CTERM sorting domain-containing protein [Sedimenticola sp.]
MIIALFLISSCETDITDTQIIVSIPTTSVWSTSAFNGFLLTILSGLDFISASFTSGVTSVQIDDGNLWVNMSGQGGGRAVINYSVTGGSIPEPATLALMGLGLAGAARHGERSDGA